MEGIEIKNLTFTYPNCKNPSLCNINLDIRSGEFVTVCGKSGSGKTTLLRHIKPPLAPYGKKCGSVLLNGFDISSLSHREQSQKIGFVMQNPDNQIVTDKVWHELAFGLESLGLPTEEIRARVAETASFFGISDWFYMNTSNLSGGQKQLLNLAAIMVMQPSVLILDEPTSRLDPIAAENFIGAVEKLNRDMGITVILTTHQLDSVFSKSDRVVVMEDGRIIADSTPQSVCKILCDASSDMAAALPSPARIYIAAARRVLKDVPLTVREGREWLFKQEVKKSVPLKATTSADLPTALEMKNVWLRYDKNLPDILCGLSLKIRKNEFYAIVGGNGAGKTTAVSAMAGLLIPYRGSISADGKIAVLPQNPQSLFAGKTVFEDLKDVLFTKEDDTAQKRLKEIIEFCELDGLLEKHPFDISGGEQQRAALAKILLTNPDILILDEPTKGLDAHFKEKLAKMLKGLCGVTIITVSHDIEFCAKYADRCGMFFDGKIVSEGSPQQFFASNSYYTTSAARMARGIIKNAVLDDDIVYALTGSEPINEYKSEEQNSKRLSVKDSDSKAVHVRTYTPQKINTAKGYSLWSAFMAFIIIPLTIFVGIYYFGDRKYYFISLLIILEITLPFCAEFERKKPPAREVVIISVLCALTVAGRAAFYMLPQFKPVAAIVIITGVCFGGEAGFLVGAAGAFVSNFFFGQGPWTPWQMFAFGMIGFIAGTLFKLKVFGKTRASFAIFGFLATFIIYGGIMNPASVLMMTDAPNKEMIVSAYITGLPFDLIHSLSTAFFLWLLEKPMTEKLDRIKLKYGLD